MLAEQLGVVPETVLDGIEDDALALPLLLEGVVHHLRVVLGADTRQDALLRFRNTQTLEGLFDVVRHVVPGALHLFLGLHIEIRLGEGPLKLREIAAPLGHGLGLIDLQGLQAELEHPLGLSLVLGDLPNDVLIQPGPRPEDGLRLGDEVELVFVEAKALDDLILRHVCFPDSGSRT